MKAAHPGRYLSYKRKPFIDYDLWEAIFTGKIATGEYAIGGNMSDIEEDGFIEQLSRCWGRETWKRRKQR